MFKKRTCWAIKPRLKLTYEKIQIVRKNRGKNAPGDALLRSAQKALRFNVLCSALKDMENFLRLVRDVSPEHFVLLVAEQTHLSRRWYMKLRPPLVHECLFLVVELVRWLTNRHPMSCQKYGILFRLYICLKPSKNSKWIALPTS